MVRIRSSLGWSLDQDLKPALDFLASLLTLGREGEGEKRLDLCVDEESLSKWVYRSPLRELSNYGELRIRSGSLPAYSFQLLPDYLVVCGFSQLFYFYFPYQSLLLQVDSLVGFFSRKSSSLSPFYSLSLRSPVFPSSDFEPLSYESALEALLLSSDYRAKRIETTLEDFFSALKEERSLDLYKGPLGYGIALGKVYQISESELFLGFGLSF